MRILLPFVIALLLFNPAAVVAQLTTALQTALVAQPETFHRIRVEFKDNVDCYALNQQFKQQKLAVSERPRTVISQLQQQAASSQSEALRLLRTQFYDKTRNLKAFWIVNILVLEAKAEAIEALAELNEVALIDLENSTIVPHDPIIRGEENAARSPGGVEPGLIAINAPAMWALGYTGRGRMVYDYDTGVWPTHPAFAERFLAHRFPINQCWYGYFSNTPNGNVSDHGTHTLGTMAGLIEATQDTIGVAFGSYWIANDFVTSTVGALPPLTDMIGAFEWALNPDGDSNTSNDIPDVINNSWRWRDDPDTVQCGGLVVNLMNAIEAAGIANIFSGGNSGPSNTTVNAPQRINTSEVNTFSVGSINGNVSFPYPISNFSTIGPTQCPSGGVSALEIHPEVVAPGQNVRSAWGTNEFSTISGTSMAAPHVSGAVLLLKEAFPYLTGEDLLWALYLTAVDLGDVGEDNVYGRGIIDVYAAFQYLAQNNTPIDPNAIAWDLGLEFVQNPNDMGFTCNDFIDPEVVISNLGDSTITSVHFEYSINGGAAMTFGWMGALLPGDEATVTFPSIGTNDFGALELSILATITAQPNEYDLYNNRWHYTVNRRSDAALPFVEGFDQGFDINNWFVQNPDGNLTWDTIPTQGLNWNSYSASVQCYKYTPRESQRDGLISSRLTIPNTTDPIWLLFDVAYQKWSSSQSTRDTLAVQISTNCGTSFDDEVYKKTGDELSTNDTAQTNFMPASEWDWRRDSVSLSQYAGQDILIRFETVNRKGNNIYIDNVKVFEGSTEPASILDLTNEVRLFPNPTSSVLFVQFTRIIERINEVNVFDVLGKQIKGNYVVSADRIKLETNDLQAGLYFLQLNSDKGTVVKRFVKE